MRAYRLSYRAHATWKNMYLHSYALPTKLAGHTVTTCKNMYLTVKVSSRKNVNIKQEKC